MIKCAVPLVGEEEAAAVREVILSGNLVQGERVREFEDQFAAWVGVEHAIAVNSGTAALHAALAAVGVGPGVNVAVTGFGFFATIEAILYLRANPVFIDVNPQTGQMSPDALRKEMEKCHIDVVLPAHWLGLVGEMDHIAALAEAGEAWLIEDAAQAHGATFDGVRAGALGDMGCFSFFATKHLTTSEGGMVTTNYPHLAARIRAFRSHGLDGRSTHRSLGYNYRMGEINAAMGLCQMKRLDQTIAARREICEYIGRGIDGIGWLRIPWPEPNTQSAYFWNPVYVKEGFSPTKVLGSLKAKGIECRYRYEQPLYWQPVLPPPTKPLPASEEIAGRFIGLPARHDLSMTDADYIINTIFDLDPEILRDGV